MRMNFALVQHHKWSYDSLMEMIAWERQIYIMLLMGYLKEENERLRLEKMSKR